MPLSNRINGIDASVFTLGGVDFLGDLKNCTITITNGTENVKGAADRWGYNAITGSDWSIEGQFYAVGSGSSIMAHGTSTTARVALAMTHASGRAFAGTVTINSAALVYETDASQKNNFSGQGYGSVTIPG